MPDREAPDWPARLELGVAGRALPGEARSGDRAVLVTYDGGALVAAIDGLGHGGEAADAAAAAAAVMAARPDAEPTQLIEACHRALARTRGAVMTIAWFDLVGESMSWTGVGNVEGRLVRADRQHGDSDDSPTLFGGVLGWSLPTVRLVRTTLAPGDCLVMATDGIAADFGSSLQPGVRADEQARRVLASHSRGSDDALVVAVRYRP